MFETLKDSILLAERSLLYALGFQFSIDHPQVFIRDALERFIAIGGPIGAFWHTFREKDNMVRPVSLTITPSIACHSVSTLCIRFSHANLARQFALGSSSVGSEEAEAWC